MFRFQPGQIVDKYRVLELLGGGGCGEAWKAWDKQLSRHVVVKCLREHRVADLTRDAAEEARRRFQQEARAQARLSHIRNRTPPPPPPQSRSRSTLRPPQVTSPIKTASCAKRITEALEPRRSAPPFPELPESNRCPRLDLPGTKLRKPDKQDNRSRLA